MQIKSSFVVVIFVPNKGLIDPTTLKGVLRYEIALNNDKNYNCSSYFMYL